MCEKYQHRLSQGIVTKVQQMQGDLSPVVCEGFNYALLHYLNKNDQKNLNKLLPHLKVVIGSAVSITFLKLPLEKGDTIECIS